MSKCYGVTIETPEHLRVDKIGDVNYTWIMSNFKPYVRPKEYEYRFAYVDKSGGFEISNLYYKTLEDYKSSAFSYPDNCKFEKIELSKREVK